MVICLTNIKLLPSNLPLTIFITFYYINMTQQQSQKNRLQFMKEITTYLDRDHSGIVAVLKAHLFAEQMLNAILICNLQLSEAQLEDCRLSFAQKVKLVIYSEKLSKEIEKSLISLNRLRNKCAHKFNFELMEKHWEDIFSPFFQQMPYNDLVPKHEDQKWLRWAGWLLGLLFPTADVYENES